MGGYGCGLMKFKAYKTDILEKGINWRKLSCTLSSTHDIIDVQDSVQEVMIWTM